MLQSGFEKSVFMDLTKLNEKELFELVVEYYEQD